jgi:molybdopterin-guanine dinucleotide biosynthesis protein B
MVSEIKRGSYIERISSGASKHLPERKEVAMPVVSFIGSSNSGKNTLLESVIRELKLRGYRVAVIKHAHHDFDMDRPGKDSWRFARAGSDIVAVSTPEKMAFIDYTTAEPALDEIERLFTGKVDILLTEGYKSARSTKILVTGTEPGPERPINTNDILATITARLSPLGVPRFDSGDINRVVNLIIAQIGENSLPESGETVPHEVKP